MKKEINPFEVMTLVRIFLRRFCAYKHIDEPKFTLFVYYKTGQGQGAVPIENAEVNEIQRKLCYNLLLEMTKTRAQTSKDFDQSYDNAVGAVSTESMIVAMAGIENMAARAIVLSALHYAKLVSDHDYGIIKADFQQPDLFVVLEKHAIWNNIITNPCFRDWFFCYIKFSKQFL